MRFLALGLALHLVSGSRFLGDTLERVRSMPTPVLLMVENGDELGGLAAVRDIDAELKRRSKDDHRTFLDEKLKRP